MEDTGVGAVWAGVGVVWVQALNFLQEVGEVVWVQELNFLQTAGVGAGSP